MPTAGDMDGRLLTEFVPASRQLARRSVVQAPISLHNQDRINPLQVLVRDNNVDQALRVLKKKMQREGILRELKRRKAYEKPSERKAREKAEAIRRGRKAARKLAQREGLIPGPKPLTPGGAPGGR